VLVFTVNSGGSTGGFTLTGMSAANAPGPNDMIAKLNAAPTQTEAHFSKVMTLPFYLWCSIRRFAVRCADKRVLPRATRAARDHLTETPTMSVMDRRNRPPIAPSSSQAMCQNAAAPTGQRRCRKTVTAAPKR